LFTAGGASTYIANRTNGRGSSVAIETVNINAPHPDSIAAAFAS
jgi:hypothetical protein